MKLKKLDQTRPATIKEAVEAATSSEQPSDDRSEQIRPNETNDHISVLNDQTRHEQTSDREGSGGSSDDESRAVQGGPKFR